MSEWRRIGIERLPELKQIIEHAESPDILWFDLRMELINVCRSDVPNHLLIAAIFGFASWCWKNSRSQTLSTAVAMNLFARIPADTPVRTHVASYLSSEDFEKLRQAGVFNYEVTPQEVELFAEEFFSRKQARERLAWLGTKKRS